MIANDTPHSLNQAADRRRWQEHYDSYLETLREETPHVSICAEDAAAQYADDMMEQGE